MQSKHSGAGRVEVQLWEDSGEIHLVVSDSGRGFDSESAMQGRGLGLTSMRERVRLVNGTIAVESMLGGGTTIHVRVPLTPVQISQRAGVIGGTYRVERTRTSDARSASLIQPLRYICQLPTERERES